VAPIFVAKFLKLFPVEADGRRYGRVPLRFSEMKPTGDKPMHSARTDEADALLTEVQTADLLNISIRTLQAWRVRGGGPRFVRAGRAIRYRRRDLLTWMEQNTAISTSDVRSNE